MSNESNNGGKSYRVISSQSCRKQIHELGARAIAKGLGPSFIAAWREIHAALAEDPENFGDPFAQLPAMQLRLYLRVLGSVQVVYCVDSHRRIVYVQLAKPFMRIEN